MDLRQRLERLAAKREAAPATAGPDTAERLKRLLDASPRADRPARMDEAAVAARLGGSLLEPGLVLVEDWLPPDHVHGRAALSGLLDAPLEALATSPVRPDSLLFLDTETTGLAGGTGTLPFLLGLARPEDGGLRLRQYFLTGFRGERALLEHARAWLAACGHVVSYNGKRFDLPLLATRHRLRCLDFPLDGKPHIDLLHPTRAAFAARWADCRLQRTETELLGVVRRDDLPGWLVPQVWTEFVRTGAVGDVHRILEHNRIDVVTLAVLLAEMARIHAVPGDPRADAHALARARLRAGEEEAAPAHLLGCRDGLGVDGLLELARRHRRRERWNEAVAIWQPLADQGVARALEALAKYREHVARDYAGALAACRELLVLEPGENAHRQRLARLQGRRSQKAAA